MLNLDPAYLQRNIESLAKIGGVYNLLALDVELRHADILAVWRLDNEAKSAVVLIAEQGQTPNTTTPNTQRNADAQA